MALSWFHVGHLAIFCFGHFFQKIGIFDILDNSWLNLIITVDNNQTKKYKNRSYFAKRWKRLDVSRTIQSRTIKELLIPFVFDGMVGKTIRRRTTMVQNSMILRHQNSYFPMSEGVSEVSERANEWAQRRARAKRAVRSKRTSERCERTSERTSEWPSTYVLIFGYSRPQCSLFQV